jgi:hypothetical protein
MRNWPSAISAICRTASRHKPGARKGNMPSKTRNNANAAQKSFTAAPLPYFFWRWKYSKNSLSGSSTSTLPCCLKLCR